MQYTLPKFFILRGYHSFSDVIHNGQLQQTESLQCFYKIIDREVTKKETKKNSRLRIGFSVPKKKIPLAVHRNRIKRLLREAFRKNQELFSTLLRGNIDIDMVVIYRKNFAQDRTTENLHTIEQEWVSLVQLFVERIQGKQ